MKLIIGCCFPCWLCVATQVHYKCHPSCSKFLTKLIKVCYPCWKIWVFNFTEHWFPCLNMDVLIKSYLYTMSNALPFCVPYRFSKRLQPRLHQCLSKGLVCLPKLSDAFRESFENVFIDNAFFKIYIGMRDGHNLNIKTVYNKMFIYLWNNKKGCSSL